MNQTSILSCLQEESGESTDTSDKAADVERRSSAGELGGRAGLDVTTGLGGVASTSRDRGHDTSTGRYRVRSAGGVGSNGNGNGRAVGRSLRGLGGGLLGLGSLGRDDDSCGVSRDAQDCRRADDICRVLIDDSGGSWARNCGLLNHLGGGDLSVC